MFRFTKIGFLVWAIIFVFAVASAHADDYHYYSLGSQIDVEPSDSLVTIVFVPGYDPGAGGSRYWDAPLDPEFEPVQVDSSANSKKTRLYGYAIKSLMKTRKSMKIPLLVNEGVPIALHDFTGNYGLDQRSAPSPLGSAPFWPAPRPGLRDRQSAWPRPDRRRIHGFVKVPAVKTLLSSAQKSTPGCRSRKYGDRISIKAVNS